MKLFTIADGRTAFWQWDLDRKLIISDDVCGEVHFCNYTSQFSLVCEIYELEGQRVVDVPNILLQTPHNISVYAYVKDNAGGYTSHSVIIPVRHRSKPDDYVYTETEVKRWVDLEQRVGALEQNSGGGSADWSVNDPDAPGYVKNRTHWVEQAFEPIVWDGNTEGMETTELLGTPFYKLNAPVTVVPFLAGATVTAYSAKLVRTVSTKLVDKTADFYALVQQQGIILPDGIYFFAYESTFLDDHGSQTDFASGILLVPIEDTEYLASGVWYSQSQAGYSHSLTISYETIKPIDEKFLPDTVLKRGYIQNAAVYVYEEVELDGLGVKEETFISSLSDEQRLKLLKTAQMGVVHVNFRFAAYVYPNDECRTEMVFPLTRINNADARIFHSVQLIDLNGTLVSVYLELYCERNGYVQILAKPLFPT